MRKMRYYKVMVLLFVVVLVYKANAQEMLTLRHIKGIRSVDFTGGVGQNCVNGELRYAKFLSSNIFIQLAGNFEKTKFSLSTLTDYTLKASACYSLFKVGENVFINCEGGLFGGFERNEEYKSEDRSFNYLTQNKFVWGGFIGGNIEIYLNSNVALIGHFQQHYINSSDFGTLKYQINGGFRFILNQ